MSDAARLDLSLRATRGLDEAIGLAVDGDAVDFTGYAARAVFLTPRGLAALLTLTAANGATVEGPLARLVVGAADLVAALPIGRRGVWFWEVIAPGGAVTRLAEGTWEMRP